jgi:hypothetical protein
LEFFCCRISTPPSAGYRRGKVCPICGEKNFSRLSHHLAISHNLDRQEILTLLAYNDPTNTNNNNINNPSIASVSGSSPINTPSNALDKSPQQTPISINTNNQQITCPSSPINELDNHQLNQTSLTTTTTTTSSSPLDQQSSNYLPIDGKKRLLCPRCDTWVLNLTDHLIKKHHLSSKQERLPFLRLARNRESTINTEKSSPNAFLISPNEQQTSIGVNKKYHSIIKKYRKNILTPIPASSSPLHNHETSSTINLNSSKQISMPRNSTKDVRNRRLKSANVFHLFL